MTQKNLEKVKDRLAKLHGYAYFRPQEGLLKTRLSEAVLEGVSADAAETLADAEFGLEVNVGQPEGEEEVQVGFRLDYPGLEYRSQIALHVLSGAELDDLADYLEPKLEEPAAAETAPAGKGVLRKKHDGEEYLEKEPAAGRLKVTPEWLKSVIPCTDYSYEEIEGKKYIRDYYWSKELIERLFRIKNSKTTPEDLQYVAQECCEGDAEWARDLIARLKSPNRPEPAPREQSQKGQGRGAALKAQPAKHPQNRQAQPKAQPAKQPTAAATANPAHANQGAAPNERSRRSRHRRPFRGERKDQGPKPEQGGQK